MNRFAVGIALMLPTATFAADGEDAKLAAFFQKYLDDECRQRPLEATRLGDHRYDNRLDDLSAAGRRAVADRYKQTRDELPRAVDHDKLSRDGQIDFEIFRHHLDRTLWLFANTRPYEEDPRIYNEYIGDSVYLVLLQSSLPKDQNVRNAAGRMRFIPAVVKAARAALTNPPKQFVETALRQNLGSIAFYEKGIFDLTGETPQLSELGPPAREAVAALKEYQQFLEKELLPRADGEWDLGKMRFAAKLDLELNAGVSAEEVVRDAEAEAGRVEREMYVIARQMWAGLFPKRPLPPDDAAGRRDTITAVLGRLAQDHGKPETLVGDARATVERIKTFIRDKDVLRLPEPDRCLVVEMPEFQRGNSMAYLNPAPPLDPKAASVYAVSPPPRDWDDR